MDKENLENYQLECFEGPLDLLLHLIQKEEVEIFDLALESLALQLMEKIKNEKTPIDEGSEAMWLIATLAHIKSRKLLPLDKEAEEFPDEGDFRLKLMSHLIEYQRYKQAASFLEKREIDQSSFFCRKEPPSFERKIPSGLEEVKLPELVELFSDMVKAAEHRPILGKERGAFIIKEEKWLVSDKISWFKKEFKEGEKIAFETLFSNDKCREEIIILFLALLELIKSQTFLVLKENENIFILNNHVN